jgi:hypothetical protein
MLMLALTKPRTTEYGRSHLSVSRKESLLRSSPASRPINPSVETTKGVKCLRCSRQNCRYFFFFSRSCEARTLWESRDQYVLASVSVTWTSTTKSVPRAQMLIFPVRPSIRPSVRPSVPDHVDCKHACHAWFLHQWTRLRRVLTLTSLLLPQSLDYLAIT